MTAGRRLSRDPPAGACVAADGTVGLRSSYLVVGSAFTWGLERIDGILLDGRAIGAHGFGILLAVERLGSPLTAIVIRAELLAAGMLGVCRRRRAWRLVCRRPLLGCRCCQCSM
jgi:hypothetical protein